MTDVMVLQRINEHIKDLHGLHVNFEVPITIARLERYALIILFYKLNNEWGCFPLEYALEAINTPYLVISIIDRVHSHGAQNL